MKVSSGVVALLLGVLSGFVHVAFAVPRKKCKSLKRRGKKCMMRAPTKMPTTKPTKKPTTKPTYAPLESVACTGVGTTKSYRSHLYKAVSSGIYTWDEARAEAANFTCCGAAGHLASITSQGENDFIHRGMGSFSESIGWIGFSNTTPESTFVWATGEAVNYTNWDVGQPNDLDDGASLPITEACVEMRGTTGKWYDAQCSIPRGVYIIEFDCT